MEEREAKDNVALEHDSRAQEVGLSWEGAGLVTRDRLLKMERDRRGPNYVPLWIKRTQRDMYHEKLRIIHM